MLSERAVLLVLVPSEREVVVEIESRRLFSLLRPSEEFFLYMVVIVPNRLDSVRVRDVSTVIQVIFEKSHSALSEVSEFYFLDVHLDRVVETVAMYDDSEIRFVVEIRRSAYIV